MSDVSRGTGWWLATDGKWYPASETPPHASPPTRRSPAHRSPRRQKGSGGPGRALLASLGVVVIVVVIAVVVVVLTMNGANKKKSAGANPPGHAPTTSATASSLGSGTAPPATTVATGATSAPTAGSAPALPSTPTAAAPPIVLTGTGHGTPTFTAAGGLTVLTAQYGGPDAFSLDVLDSTGQSVDVPISTIGGYSGTVSEALNPGSYTLNVAATAAWTVTITQPRNQQAFHLPYVFNNGGRDALIGPFRADGAYQITATNHGLANFMVRVLDTKGYEHDIPINQIGDYNGSVAESSVIPGNYYLQVNSSGSWTINVSAL